MHLDWEPDDGDWPNDREFKIYDEGGTVVEVIGTKPTLNELREAEHRHDERFDLLEAELTCVECDDLIEDRFAADMGGNVLCWSCATDEQAIEHGSIRINLDTTQATISESNLYEKSLCDYVVNVATGCRHGCKFCYVPTTPGYESREHLLEEQTSVDDPQMEWGNFLLYRDDLPERIHRKLEQSDLDDWQRTERGRGVVMLSSGTDPYQDRRAAQITRGAVKELIDHDITVRILTRSPNLLRDKDLFKKAGNLVTVGSSIPSFDTDLVRAIEPNAPPPMARWNALDELQKAGVSVYVSMSPTYPGMDVYEIDRLLGHFRALGDIVVFHEPINPRGQNFEMLADAVREAGRVEMVERFKQLQDRDKWVDYAVRQISLVQERVRERHSDLKLHTWPDRLLVEETSGELSRKLREMRQARSPEFFVAVGQEQPESQPTIDVYPDQVRQSI